MKEQPILKRILLACSRGKTRLWRNNVGLAWVGKVTKVNRTTTVTLHKGDVYIRNARPFRAGVEGMSDLIGWDSVVITPEMVGQTVAIFTALEVKSKTGRIRDKQQLYIDNVKASGGIAGVVRSVEEAKSLLTG